MTRVSTSLLSAGPRFAGSWGDRAWRLALTAQLVEGSDPAYWIVSPTEPALYRVSPDLVEVDVPHSEAVVDSVILMLAVRLGDENVEGLLLDSHLISLVDGVRTIAPYWAPLADDVRSNLAAILSRTIRVGFTQLDEMSLADTSVIVSLRELGLDVDEFTLASSAIGSTS
jgi:hypothetical protein